jgi:hypothetical protein
VCVDEGVPVYFSYIYLCYCNDTFGSSDYNGIASNGKMISEQWIRKEARDAGFEVVFGNLPGRH